MKKRDAKKRVKPRFHIPPPGHIHTDRKSRVRERREWKENQNES